MKHPRSFAWIVLSVSVGGAALVACSSSNIPEDGGGNAVGGSAGGGDVGGGSTGTSLPCDIAPIVEKYCTSCHGDPPSSSAPNSLLTVDQWKAPSASEPSKSEGQVSVERMASTIIPMPPTGTMDPAEIQTIADWVSAGMPGGDCQPNTVEDPILNADPVCTSGDMWPANSDFVFGKDRAEMFPGMPCIDCHVNPQNYGFNEHADRFEAAGTIFPTGHEPDRCAGLSSNDVKIHIEDAGGHVYDLTPNAAGNFILEQPLTPPYSASVVTSTGERAMVYKPTSGDCNLCHTQDGSDGGEAGAPVAPGRIVLPLPPQ